MMQKVPFLILSGILLLAGCADKEPEHGDGTEEPAVSAAGDIVQGKELFYNEYIPMLLKKPEGEYAGQEVYADIRGSRLYILSAYEVSSRGEESCPSG